MMRMTSMVTDSRPNKATTAAKDWWSLKGSVMSWLISRVMKKLTKEGLCHGHGLEEDSVAEELIQQCTAQAAPGSVLCSCLAGRAQSTGIAGWRAPRNSLPTEAGHGSHWGKQTNLNYHHGQRLVDKAVFLTFRAAMLLSPLRMVLLELGSICLCGLMEGPQSYLYVLLYVYN